MAIQVVMPEMGEGVIEGTVSQWLKQEGEQVEEFEAILEIETDKVTTEATSEAAGTLLKIYVAQGETVPVGTVLAVIGEPGEEVPDDPNLLEEAETAPLAEAPAESATPGRSNGGRVAEQVAAGEEEAPFAGWASPVVKRIAAEHDVDLNRVEGSGRGGRITKKDILSYLETRGAEPEERERIAPPAREAPRAAVTPAAAQLPGVESELLPHTNMRRRIAEHMLTSKRTSPHVTTVFEADFARVAAHRAAHKVAFARQGARLTFTPYLVAATAQALREHPLVNSSWSDDGLILHKAINIGMATALDEGLIVPVIKNADHYNLMGLARQVNDLAERARSNRLQPAEVQGGTFSITNHGTSGSLFATPIINQPQVGILGAGIIEKRVKVIDDAIAIRPMAYLSFTFDHRVLDGASADYFVARIKELIENWE
ncbi:MAG: dihydrolipoamide acetyltransferase family protein [Anaerolineae bacterium]|nr:dihydrolipoamide acetyltransferase family protein [Anaerolineae bacterium]